MSDPADWLTQHYDKFLTGIGSIGGTIALAWKKVMHLEKRIGELEKTVADHRTLDEKGHKEVLDAIKDIQARFEEQDRRIAVFWQEKWPQVVTQDARLKALETLCEDIKDDIRDIRKAVLRAGD